LANLATHFHVLYVHAQDSQGNWGPFVSIIFHKDSVGPITSKLAVTPSPTSTPPTITGQVSDKGTGLSKILAAEYFIDTPGNPGTGTPMVLGKVGDGGVLRLVSAVIPDNVWAALALGKHVVYVRGEDALGNWGALASISFTKLASSFANALVIGSSTGPIAAWKPTDSRQGQVAALRGHDQRLNELSLLGSYLGTQQTASALPADVRRLAWELHSFDHPLALALLLDSESWAGGIWLGKRHE
jgi:hypothetical protein